PFGVEELMARIRAFLRTVATGTEDGPIYDDGILRIDLAQREVAVHGEAVTLSRKEFSLLALLVRQPGRLVTQAQILREMWGPTHEEDTTTCAFSWASCATSWGTMPPLLATSSPNLG